MSLRSQWQDGRDCFLSDTVAAHGLLKRINGGGEHLLALEIGESILENGKLEDDVPVRQQMARALAVLGSCDEARKLLEEIPSGRKDEGETLGLLARVWKDLAISAGELEEVKRCYREAFKCYAKGYLSAQAAGDDDGAAYCGINAAAMSVILGNVDEAKDYAAKAAGHASEDEGYYGTATRAEAALILADTEKAETLYRATSELGEKGRQWADLASTRKQCRALSQILQGRRDFFDACFVSGAVAILSGQIFAGDAEPSKDVVGGVESRVSSWLEENKVRHVFVGAMPGWDLILADVARKAGMEIHLILPYETDAFFRDVIAASGSAERFAVLRNCTASVTTLSRDAIREQSGSRLFVDKMIAARGSLLANHLGVTLRGLVVGDDKGSTAASVWHEANLEQYAIYPSSPELDGVMEKDVVPNPVPFPQTLGAIVLRQPVLAILHLHFHGYAELGSKGYALFREKVLEELALCVSGLNRPVASVVGIGGEYSFAFSGVYAAAEAAMKFSELLEKSLEGTQLRMPAICLHAGPVGMEVNPLLHIHAPEGETVTRCAVISGQLPAGSICATETFAALSVLEAVRGFRFEHSGKIEINGNADRLFRLQATA